MLRSVLFVCDCRWGVSCVYPATFYVPCGLVFCVGAAAAFYASNRWLVSLHYVPGRDASAVFTLFPGVAASADPRSCSPRPPRPPSLQHAMATCLEMIFTYETSSMLHTSVAASVLAILIPAATSAGAGARRGSSSSPGEAAVAAAAAATEGGEESEAASGAGADSIEEGGGGGGGDAGVAKGGGGRREPFQRHLFEDCRLVERILEAVALNEDAEKPQQEPAPMPDSDPEPAAAAGEGTGDSSAGAPAGAAATDGGDVESTDVTVAATPAVPEEGGSGGRDGVETAAATSENQEATASGEGEGGPAEGTTAGVSTPGEDAATAAAAAAAAVGSAAGSGVGEGVRKRARPGRRLGHMGHVLLLSRAVMGAENGEHGGGVSSVSPRARPPGAGAMLNGSEGAEVGGDGQGAAEGEGEQGGEAAAGAGAGAGAGVSAPAAAASRKSFVAGLLARRECVEHWHEFVNTTLAEEVSRQMNPLGGFTVPSRADENQLSSDFPDEVCTFA